MGISEYITTSNVDILTKWVKQVLEHLEQPGKCKK